MKHAKTQKLNFTVSDLLGMIAETSGQLQVAIEDYLNNDDGLMKFYIEMEYYFMEMEMGIGAWKAAKHLVGCEDFEECDDE